MSARVVVSRWLARTALLLLWSLVAWGALVLLATLGHVAGRGPAARPSRASCPPAGASAWAWGNAVAVALAVGVGMAGREGCGWSRGGLAGVRGGATPPRVVGNISRLLGEPR